VLKTGRYHGFHGKMNTTTRNYRLLFLITGMVLLMIPASAVAAGMDIAMSTWCCQWMPSWSTPSSVYKVDPAFFYGPGLSFRLPGNVTISSGFLYARLEAASERKRTSIPWSPTMESRVINRYDSDTTVGYSFTRFFKLFAGFKYTQYKYQNNETLWLPLVWTLLLGTLEKYRYDNYAPALGIGFSIHVVENFFILINTSLLYESSSINRRKYWYSSGTPSLVLPFPEEQWSLHKIGANANLSFVYFIKPIHTNISVGFRYQFFKTVWSESRNEDYSEYCDHFYGLTASVIYRIDFGKKKEEEKKEVL